MIKSTLWDGHIHPLGLSSQSFTMIKSLIVFWPSTDDHFDYVRGCPIVDYHIWSAWPSIFLRVYSRSSSMNFYILIINKKELVLCEKWLSLRYETPWVRKSEKSFVNQSHPTKIVNVRGIFMLSNFSFWKNKKLQYWFLKVLMNFY